MLVCLLPPPDSVLEAPTSPLGAQDPTSLEGLGPHTAVGSFLPRHATRPSSSQQFIQFLDFQGESILAPISQARV